MFWNYSCYRRRNGHSCAPGTTPGDYRIPERHAPRTRPYGFLPLARRSSR
jgi:hypothetical protein